MKNCMQADLSDDDGDDSYTGYNNNTIHKQEYAHVRIHITVK